MTQPGAWNQIQDSVGYYLEVVDSCVMMEVSGKMVMELEDEL